MSWLELASAVFVGMLLEALVAAAVLAFVSGRGRRKQMKRLHSMIQQRVDLIQQQQGQREPASAE